MLVESQIGGDNGQHSDQIWFELCSGEICVHVFPFSPWNRQANQFIRLLIKLSWALVSAE
jgi:hypothetical protein